MVELIHCVPDIACFGKLMTGEIIPLAVTLATNAIFDSFIGDSKTTSREAKLREDGVYMRPLGNVIYLLCGPSTFVEVCNQFTRKLLRRLEEFDVCKN
ncbi:hypothetical protein JHK82_024631 [Glycine max]|nr:hypothetical protein JHK85_025236 [Glycine max]KAG5012475.1 hypothetical protein JHK86_024736 [Glycine max]KAG5133443.1 hypothetical protein JHK82_024631 [Glycine max]